VTDLIEYT